jgi:hypothetical protein
MIERGTVIRQFAMCAIFLAVVTQGLLAQTYMHPRLASREKTIRSVALLPPTAQMVAEGAFRDDIKEKEAEPLIALVGTVMSDTLKKHGWTVNDTLFVTSAAQEKENLKNLVGFLCFRHQTIVAQIKPKDVAKGRCSLSNRVAELGAQVPVDAFVLVHADGNRSTIAAWILHPEATLLLKAFERDVTLRISLVDSQTGEILSYSKTGIQEKEILKELSQIP